MKTIQFAVISPYNKQNLMSFIRDLVNLNPKIEFIATSGSYKLLQNEITNLSTIEQFTGYQESPEGLVKTLHPKIFFGYLGNPLKSEDHKKAFEELGTKPIDLLISNLYPFWEIKNKKLTINEMTYYWDIGGPSMIMAAIKGNHTTVLTDPDDYDSFLQALKEGKDSQDKFFKQLNLKALKYVVDYHKMIGEYFEQDFNLM